MTKKDNKKGFTIIEVVLVLAIAGLIFAMVFIALPALQRSQRDQSRKNDASTVAAAITNWNSSLKMEPKTLMLGISTLQKRSDIRLQLISDIICIN